jgi:hypothetical protein
VTHPPSYWDWWRLGDARALASYRANAEHARAGKAAKRETLAERLFPNWPRCSAPSRSWNVR